MARSRTSSSALPRPAAATRPTASRASFPTESSTSSSTASWSATRAFTRAGRRAERCGTAETEPKQGKPARASGLVRPGGSHPGRGRTPMVVDIADVSVADPMAFDVQTLLGGLDRRVNRLIRVDLRPPHRQAEGDRAGLEPDVAGGPDTFDVVDRLDLVGVGQENRE